MKSIPVILVTGMMLISSALFAQSKNEMPFTSSSAEAKKLLREAWVAYGDAKFSEGDKLVSAALEKDPDFGLAYACIITNEDADREQNLKKASVFKLSPDEKLLVDGFVANQERKPVDEYFDPLLKKYPKDNYLGLWIMFNQPDIKRRIEIGENLIKLSPKFAPAYNMLGYAYLSQNGLTQAEASFNKYLSLRPDLANPYDSKADYLMKVGKIDDAIRLYEKAAELGLAVSKGRADVAKAMLKYPPISDKDKEEIRSIISESSAGYLKSDVDAIMKYYSEQAIEFFPNQMINAGFANIRNRVGGNFRYGSITKMERSVQFIEGIGPIAVVWCKTESAFKAGNGKIYEDMTNDIFLTRKQQNGEWKILAQHWFGTDKEENAQPSEDLSDIRKMVNKWSFFMKPGEVLAQEHVENIVGLYSPQAVEIYPNQQSNIGIANIRLRNTGFKGIKWAAFTQLSFDVNSIATIGENGFAQKAVAWGIGDHSNYPEGSDEVAQYLFPWVMILTKENGEWKILVYHFYLE